jgi:Domain of unknown function (DUF4412)
MKCILPGAAGLMAAVLSVQCAFAQFTGRLVYEVDKATDKTVMAYYQKGTSGLIEAYNEKLVNGATDTTTLHAQDTLLFDFAGATETHMQYKTMSAYKTKYSATEAQEVAANKPIAKGTVDVTSKGAETVNGYNCTHYVITSSSMLGTSTRDVWITGDLGPAPAVYVISLYTYFTPGHPVLAKLTAAGANGVVVKSVSSYAKASLVTTMNLILIDTKTPLKAALFQVPSRYTMMDRTNFTMPSKP